MLLSGLVSRVQLVPSHRANLIGPFSLGQNCLRRNYYGLLCLATVILIAHVMGLLEMTRGQLDLGAQSYMQVVH